MYTFGSRIRYSETDEYGKLTLTGIMNYLQDCSTFQSEDIGLGISYLTEHHQAWWLSSWQIVIDRYPALGEEVVIGTWPVSYTHLDVYKRQVAAAGGTYTYRNGKVDSVIGKMCIRDRFIYAKMKDRIRRMNSLETGVDPVKMESRIREVDRKRKDYYQYYTGNEWGKAQNYHLSLESGLVGVDGCLKAVLAYLESVQ